MPRLQFKMKRKQLHLSNKFLANFIKQKQKKMYQKTDKYSNKGKFLTKANQVDKKKITEDQNNKIGKMILINTETFNRVYILLLRKPQQI